MLRFLLIFSLWFFSGPLNAAETPGPVVSTSAGLIRGVSEDGLKVFKGVPYATAPTGDLRWKAPQPPEPWTGVRDAQSFAPACMQKGVSMPGETLPAMSEDCLYLNVWTPGFWTSGVRGKPKPVMVWIHGGGFSNGSAAMPLYWGDRLAKRGIVVVSIAYRLGALGFLAHPEEGNDAGNYGLKDQVAALRWVRDNIKAFGGDPSQVTIAGQSAGGMSVSLLLAIPEARGLFHRAIAQSGGMFEPLELAPGYMLKNAVRDGQTYAASVGAKTLADLRKLPAEALLGGRANGVGHPVIGSAFLPRTAYEAYRDGAVAFVPVLIGWNADEARSLTRTDSITAAGFERDLTSAFGALPPSIFAAYPHATDPEAKQAGLDFERDLRFGWDMWAWARLQARRGGAAYVYSFARKPPFPDNSPYAGWGASHFAELWYMSGHLDQADWPWQARDRQLEGQMLGYWANFIKTGDPNGAGLVYWRPFSEGSQVLRFDEATHMDDVPGLKGLDAFDQAYSAVRGKPF